MKTREFYFNLPSELIAQKPSDRRGESRMLVLDKNTGKLEHRGINDFVNFVDKNTLIVVNNSKVRKARLFGFSETGGKVEFLLTKQLNSKEWLVMVSKKKKQYKGKIFSFPGKLSGEITGEEGELRKIRFSKSVDDLYLDVHGHIPLPPYIKREDTKEDWIRYQTVYARETGSTAAPTAGLHFTELILNQLKTKGIVIVPVTLHVGMGTFIPVRCEEVEEHNMHKEEYEIPPESARLINEAKRTGKKILAVGTTSVRTLESSWRDGQIMSGKGSTDLFIYPGYTFKVVDQMLTNFHTPDSSLIILVSAFAGIEEIKNAYKTAIDLKYRFFSYGDAMFIR